MKLEQGQIVKWENAYGKQILWMICDDTNQGMVIHSDNLLKIGTITQNIKNYNLTPFIGSVNIKSS